MKEFTGIKMWKEFILCSEKAGLTLFQKNKNLRVNKEILRIYSLTIRALNNIVLLKENFSHNH
jgi:hypothetical protein